MWGSIAAGRADRIKNHLKKAIKSEEHHDVMTFNQNEWKNVRNKGGQKFSERWEIDEPRCCAIENRYWSCHCYVGSAKRKAGNNLGMLVNLHHKPEYYSG